jgi:broad specificity phosphatase PhoE
VASPPRVYLARHGQTAYNLEGRFQGQLPIPLDATGRAQAVDLAERAVVHGFAALWCSPLQRARETADAVAARIGLEPREDARLMETDAGDWTDRPFSEIQAQAPAEFAKFVAGDPAFAFPGGESFAQQGVRVAAAIYDIRRAEAPALVVCHGGVIRLALAMQLKHGTTLAERVPNGALIPLDPREARRAEHGEDTEAATIPG